jgi:hypothetical protein
MRKENEENEEEENGKEVKKKKKVRRKDEMDGTGGVRDEREGEMEGHTSTIVPSAEITTLMGK